MEDRVRVRLSISKGSALYEHIKNMSSTDARHEIMYLANNGLRLERDLLRAHKSDPAQSAKQVASDEPRAPDKSSARLDIEEPTKGPVDVGGVLDDYF